MSQQPVIAFHQSLDGAPMAISEEQGEHLISEAISQGSAHVPGHAFSSDSAS